MISFKIFFYKVTVLKANMNLQLPFPFFGSFMSVTEIPFISQQIAESGEINKFGDLLFF